MKTIICDATFNDGRDRYERGDIRVVSIENGARFIGHGWARELTAEQRSAIEAMLDQLPAGKTETTLDVQSSVLGVTSTVKT
jgi:hypothetical protein